MVLSRNPVIYKIKNLCILNRDNSSGKNPGSLFKAVFTFSLQVPSHVIISQPPVNAKKHRMNSSSIKSLIEIIRSAIKRPQKIKAH